MHGVVKNSSTATKLRVVFDASAHSESGASLNDQLLSGPSLYPHLTKVVNRFRTHSIGMSSDVSKMFREVGLQPSERDFHRFLMRNDSGDIVDMRMTRLTFGVTSSQFLASKVLRQVADDYEESYPRAAAVVRSNFYVDDCLTGANTLEDTTSLRSELNALLGEAKMKLRKWRTSSEELLDTIPVDLREDATSQLTLGPEEHPKTLGIHWSTTQDCFFVAVPPLNSMDSPTKRKVASDAAKVFDIMGWFSPVVLLLRTSKAVESQNGLG